MQTYVLSTPRVILGTRISLPSAGSQASHGKNPSDLRWHQKKFLMGYSSLEKRKTYLAGRRHRAKERLWSRGQQRGLPTFIQTLGRYSSGRCSVRPATPVSTRLGLIGKHQRFGSSLVPHKECPFSSGAGSSPHRTLISAPSLTSQGPLGSMQHLPWLQRSPPSTSLTSPGENTTTELPGAFVPHCTLRTLYFLLQFSVSYMIYFMSVTFNSEFLIGRSLRCNRQ